MAKTDQDELARQLRACVSAAQCVNVLREQVQREAQVRHRPHELQDGRELKVIKVVRLFEDLPTGPYLVFSISDGSYKLVDVLQNEVTRVAPPTAKTTVPLHASPSASHLSAVGARSTCARQLHPFGGRISYQTITRESPSRSFRRWWRERGGLNPRANDDEDDDSGRGKHVA